jgi:2-polyprenyl-6-methoxyphenol hydroxylase-like FAD-dependent oxidoreductase
MRDIDPLLFQGSHPDTGAYLWYSTLSTPETNGSRGNFEEYYEGQLIMSWLYKTAEDDVPPTNTERVKKMKVMAEGFEPRLLQAVLDIPSDARVLEIKLQDWPPQPYDSLDGRVTLIGDAAHAMTMYRGEAFNHGITDAALLSEKLSKACQGSMNWKNLAESVSEYEEEMRKRCYGAVLLSRQACLDAHDIQNLGPESPLVSKRAKIVAPERV